MRKLVNVLLLLSVIGMGAGIGSAALPEAPQAEAFSQPMPDLTDGEREQFFRGRNLVRQSWVAAPSQDVQFQGLGPLYNRLACISCHARNGRGEPPENGQQRLLSMLVRLSVPGVDAHGGPKPHPAYGGQFNDEGIPGVPGEGRAHIAWQEVITKHLPGGEQVTLRRPQVSFSELNYGPLEGVLTSPRVGQQMVGMGYLDAVSAQTLQRMAQEAKPDGVRGRVNIVWNPATQRAEAGRFGYKANMPTLQAQIAGAFQGDIGITSLLFPQKNCTAIQAACQQAYQSIKPDLTQWGLDDATFYLAHLAPPPRRKLHDPAVQQGEALFRGMGCAVCHRPEMTSGKSEKFPRLSHQRFSPFTDLLLHDMGEGLSDGRPDYLATGSEWRTAPLWGIGLSTQVSEASTYLHDGRARSLTEAILWHDGEAASARQRFEALSKEDRAALLVFLQSL